MSLISKKIVLFFLSLILVSATLSVQAENKAVTTAPAVNSLDSSTPVIVPQAPELNAKSYILMDYNTGRILAQKQIHEPLPPASLTKLMTLYIIFSALDSGQIKLNDKVHISKTAWRTSGSKMFVREGSMVPVEDLIQGIIVDSGNDATVAMAEYIAGTQQAFIPIMNQQAKALGMTNTHFSDVNGLPIKDHLSSTYDLALLTRAIIHNFPNQYHWFQQKYYTWDKIKQANRNGLLWRDPSIDGLKTGHTDAAGYCLISSAKRDNMRLIAIIMGAPTEQDRLDENMRLLDYGFRFFNTYKLYNANNSLTQTRVWGGTRKEVSLGLRQDLYITIPKGRFDKLKIHVDLDNILKAPVVKGNPYGKLSVNLDNQVISQVPIIALQDDPKGGIWTRFIDVIGLSVQHFFNTNNQT